MKFNSEYLRKLKDADPAVESHFAEQFTRLIVTKLRARMVPAELGESICSETLRRVLGLLRQGRGMDAPERVASKVNIFSNQEMMETLKQPATESVAGMIDFTLITKDRMKLAAEVLSEFLPAEREILRSLFSGEGDAAAICQSANMEPVYLRVLLNRMWPRFLSGLTRTP